MEVWAILNWLLQASDSNRVWYAYTQEKGGKKIRITGKIRQLLKCHIQFRHYGTYLETSQASHIRGQNLHQVIDQSLLRKIWKPPVECSKLSHMVRMIKMLAEILATETVLTRRNQGTETNGKGTAVCKLCGIAGTVLQNPLRPFWFLRRLCTQVSFCFLGKALILTSAPSSMTRLLSEFITPMLMKHLKRHTSKGKICIK